MVKSYVYYYYTVQNDLSQIMLLFQITAESHNKSSCCNTKQGMLFFPISTNKRPKPGNNNGDSSKKSTNGNYFVSFKRMIIITDKGNIKVFNDLYSRFFGYKSVFSL